MFACACLQSHFQLDDQGSLPYYFAFVMPKRLSKCLPITQRLSWTFLLKFTALSAFIGESWISNDRPYWYCCYLSFASVHQMILIRRSYVATNTSYACFPLKFEDWAYLLVLVGTFRIGRMRPLLRQVAAACEWHEVVENRVREQGTQH